MSTMERLREEYQEGKERLTPAQLQILNEAAKKTPFIQIALLYNKFKKFDFNRSIVQDEVAQMISRQNGVNQGQEWISLKKEGNKKEPKGFKTRNDKYYEADESRFKERNYDKDFRKTDYKQRKGDWNKEDRQYQRGQKKYYEKTSYREKRRDDEYRGKDKHKEEKGGEALKHEERRDEPKVDHKVQVRHQAKPQPKQVKHQAKHEIKPETKVQSKHQSKAQVKADTKHQSKAEVKEQPKVEAKVEAKAEAKAETKVEAKVEAKVQRVDRQKSQKKSELQAKRKVGTLLQQAMALASREKRTVLMQVLVEGDGSLSSPLCSVVSTRHYQPI